jgi:hypothetical protein
MKTSIKSNPNGINFHWIIITVFILGIVAEKTAAQGLYFGVEVTSGSRAFNVNSDLKDFKGIKVAQQGRIYGITIGNRLISGKIRLGNFGAPKGDSKPIQSNTFELGANFSPLQLIAKRTPILEPYVIVSMETTKVKTAGTYTPPAAKPAAAASTCSCQCPSSVGGPGDPDGQPVVSTPTPFSGNFGSTKANVGIGLRAHVQKGKLFLTVYGEMNYGVTMGTTASTQALLNTYVLNQTAFNFGASIGFIHTKTGHRLRRISFR